MTKTLKLKNGLELSIEDAEMFCSLRTNSERERKDQCKWADKLARHFEAEGDLKKAKKYRARSCEYEYNFGLNFSINYIELANWFTNPRLVVSNLNKLLSKVGRTFLPSWFPLLGLSYAAQTLTAVKKNNKHLQFYWGVWFLLNAFGCLALLGGALLTGTSLVWPAIGVSIYGYLFDLKWEAFLYYRDIENQNKFIDKLKNTYGANTNLVKSFDKEIVSQNNKHKEALVLTSIILVGGVLWGLSAFFPPAFATIGAALMLGCYSYMLGKKIYNSWTNDDGLLKKYIRVGVPKILNRFSNWLTHKPTPTVNYDKLLTPTYDSPPSNTVINQMLRENNVTSDTIAVVGSSSEEKAAVTIDSPTSTLLTPASDSSEKIAPDLDTESFHSPLRKKPPNPNQQPSATCSHEYIEESRSEVHRLLHDISMSY